MRSNDLADLAASRSSGIDSSAHRGDVAPDNCRHQAGVDLFPADEAARSQP